MSQSIVDEIMFLLDSFFLGAVITCVYDSFLILRRLIRHNMLLISLEDLVFWIACAVSVYYVLYEENNGILRWFAVVGACVGMIAYKKTLSPWIVCGVSGVLEKIFCVVLWIVRFIFKPFAFLLRKAGGGGRRLKRKGGRTAKYMKKKLTACRKVFNIILCKH